MTTFKALQEIEILSQTNHGTKFRRRIKAGESFQVWFNPVHRLKDGDWLLVRYDNSLYHIDPYMNELLDGFDVEKLHN